MDGELFPEFSYRRSIVPREIIEFSISNEITNAATVRNFASDRSLTVIDWAGASCGSDDD